ncbi:tol-pal system YbgF family protein [Phocaeicola abscessus]|uniref:tetratricopeptide repeat protein n=1 Tax=Phocaeicola abscessus TaxID=555313 RepID=UPI0004B06C12|nr:tetratricopeptide repeat protein [Phocaeicola abscessus]
MAKKENIKDPLNMDEAIGASEAFLLKYKNTILGVIISIAVIILAFMGYKHFISEPRELHASETLFKAEALFRANNYEAALKGDSLGAKGFLSVIKDYSGTKAGNLANAYAGICYAQLGQYNEALICLDKFSAKDLLVNPAIMAATGNCYAQLGKLDKAADLLAKAADQADSQALSPIYLIQAGELYEKLGKNSEAIKAYKLIKDKYFNSYQAMEIDKYIERASIK